MKESFLKRFFNFLLGKKTDLQNQSIQKKIDPGFKDNQFTHRKEKQRHIETAKTMSKECIKEATKSPKKTHEQKRKKTTGDKDLKEHAESLERHVGQNTGENKEDLFLAQKDIVKNTSISRQKINNSKANYSSRILYIGFDLGTSCSKVIVRDNIDQSVIPVSFGELGFISNPFLLPSRMFLRDHKLSMEKLRANDIEIKDLKTNFINNKNLFNELPSSEIILISYFAIAFRYIRNYVVHAQRIYQKSVLHWHINIGIPCLDIIEDSLVDRYVKAVHVAWNVSLNNDLFPTISTVNTEDVTKYVNKTELCSELEADPMKDFISVFPELFASIYSQISQNRLDENCMYYMIDVGASTVDMATFNLFRDNEGELNYAIFVPTIRQIGSYRFGIDLINSISTGEIEPKIYKEILFSLAEGNREYDLYNEFGNTVIINNIYNNYLSAYRAQIGETILYTKNNFNGNALEWKSGLPTFLVGGGKAFTINSHKFYQLHMENKFCELENFGVSLPRFISAFPPEYFNDNTHLIENYHRFLVADGLANDRINLGNVLTHVKELHQQHPEPMDIRELYIGQEMD